MPLDEPPVSKNSGSAADTYAAWQRASQVALIGLFVIALLWVIYAAQHVIVPVLLAWVIATILLPLVKWLQDAGMPRPAASVSVALLFLVLVAGLFILLSLPLASWLGRASYMGALVREKLEGFSHPLALLQDLQKGLNALGGGGSPAMKVEQRLAGHPVVEAEVLGQVADTLAGVRVAGWLAEDARLAARGADQTEQDLDGCGLAGAVGTK
jgi:hypothetical protein